MGKKAQKRGRKALRCPPPSSPPPVDPTSLDGEYANKDHRDLVEWRKVLEAENRNGMLVGGWRI